MTGEVIAGRYELEELVGSGGMSAVYRAHDRLLERKVALKILHQRYGEDVEYVERFRREARAVAQLAHPNIVTVIDRGEDRGRQFIVFEYVDGDNLKQIVDRRGPLLISEVVELGLEVARGLAYAHERGIVHRDVKPQNVLLNGDGRAKVTDFGIARTLDVEKSMTQTGTVLGTSDYIAPEQASGQPVDDRSDVYSLGVVLFELLTGVVPFRGENFVTVAMRHINEPPPPVLERRPDAPPRLGDLVDLALAKDHRDRPTMQEIVAELEALRVPETTGETVVVRRRRPVRARRRSVWPLVLAALGALLLGAALGALTLPDDGVDLPIAVPKGGEQAKLIGVGAVDPPPGDKSEHGDKAVRATDGNLDTAWRTQRYNYPEGELGKPGVGILLRVVGTPEEIVVRTDTPGFTAEIRSGSRVVSNRRRVEDGTIFPLDDDVRATVVFWITNRGEHRSVRVNELSAR